MLDNVLKYHSEGKKREAIFGSFVLVFSFWAAAMAVIRLLGIAISTSVLLIYAAILTVLFATSFHVFSRLNLSIARNEKFKLALGMLACFVVLMVV